MKNKLKFLSVILVFLLTITLVACGKTEEEEGGVKTYVLEAEYIDLDNVVGAGISSEASGVNMIHGTGSDADIEKGWSQGYYLGFTYSANLELNFVFNTEKASTASIILRLGSEIGDITFTPESLSVKLNGNEISYTNLLVFGSEMDKMEFTDLTLTSNASLVAGENTITIKILENTLRSGQTGGPMIDNIKVRTDAGLTWTDKTDNPDRRGEI